MKLILLKYIQHFCMIFPGFSPNEDIYLAITNILSSSLIGIKYEPHDPDFQKWIRLGEILKQDIVTLNSGWALDFFPWLRHFGNSTFTRMQEYIQISKKPIYFQNIFKFELFQTFWQSRIAFHLLVNIYANC